MSIFDFFPAWIAVPPWVKAVEVVNFTAIGIIVLFFVAVSLLRRFAPKTGAIAWVTAREAMMQPLFLVLTGGGIVALFLFLFIPYNTLGEDIKLVITQGLTLIKLICVFLAVWTASTTIADEIEGKTALLVLAKPVGRRTFIIGKYLGVIIAVTFVFLILAAFFLNTVSYKVVYDARESAKEVPSALVCFAQVRQLYPGLILALLETMILAAIAVAISTRLSLLPNVTICLAIYVLGHLVPDLVQSAAVVDQAPTVAFVGNLMSAVLPVLSHYSMEPVIAMQTTLQSTVERELPWSYVGWAALYAAVYCTFALVLSLLLFEDRDLA